MITTIHLKCSVVLGCLLAAFALTACVEDPTCEDLASCAVGDSGVIARNEVVSDATSVVESSASSSSSPQDGGNDDQSLSPGNEGLNQSDASVGAAQQTSEGAVISDAAVVSSSESDAAVTSSATEQGASDSTIGADAGVADTTEAACSELCCDLAGCVDSGQVEAGAEPDNTPSVCGDGIRTGNEVCDGRIASTELGACDPECSGYYEKKIIRRTASLYATDLGGIGGADDACSTEFGTSWKALIVGSGRRATTTPYVGDEQQDWVLHKYRYYFNEQNQFVWRTDTVPLLGASGAVSQELLAPLFDPYSEPGGFYPWSGYRQDWTTLPESQTCNSWTSNDVSLSASFITEDLSTVATELCSAESFLLCVEQ